ncbi:MAG: hypothetical protein JNK05_17150 [Myxococcales bacterium]|nr:hypothetical protein [Myxococcales bacterium]
MSDESGEKSEREGAIETSAARSKGDGSTRLVIVLAAIAAIAGAMAIVPPGGVTARGLRIERMRGAADGRPLLLRVALEDGGTRNWRAPASVRVRAERAGGGTETVDGARVGRSPWVLVTLSNARYPMRLTVSADGHDVTTTLRADPPSPRFALSDQGRARVDVAVEGYVLTPEVGGAALFNGGPSLAGTVVDVAPDDPTLAIGPERATLDACGIVALYARPGGLAAPVLVRFRGEEHRFRLPLAPGAITTRIEGDTLTLAHPLGGLVAYVVSGDDRGPLRWEQHLLAAESDRTATARVALGGDAAWALASASTDFERVSGAWKRSPPGLSPCAATPLGEYFARIAAPTPPLPDITIVHDGAQHALDRREDRRGQNRRRALWVNALALGALAALMMRAARSTDTTLEREGLVRGSGAQRVAAYGVIALATMAFAFALAVQLRA